MKISTIVRAAVPITALVALPLGIETATAAAPAAPATSTVTIKAAGSDLYGTVASQRAACEGDRTVVLIKQKGTRGGGDDVRIASDTTEVFDGVGQWNTGNTGMAGRFYAKVTKTADCKADVSPTIKVARK
jgi:hypothetical protein